MNSTDSPTRCGRKMISHQQYLKNKMVEKEDDIEMMKIYLELYALFPRISAIR
jgi:hypothetical protein